MHVPQTFFENIVDTPRTRTLAAHYDSAPPTPHAKHLTMPGFSRRRAMISALALAGVAPAFSASAISAPADPANPWDVRHTARRSLLAEDTWFCTWMEHSIVTCPASSGCTASGCMTNNGECGADYAITFGTGATSSNFNTDSPFYKCKADTTSSDCQDSSMSTYLVALAACEAHTTESACGTGCEWQGDSECVVDTGAHAQTHCPVLFASVSGATSPRLPGAAVACAAGVAAAATLFA